MDIENIERRLLGIDNTLSVMTFIILILTLSQCSNDVDVSGELTCIIEKPVDTSAQQE